MGHSKVLNLDYLLGLSSQPFSQLSTTPRLTQPRITNTDLKRPHLLSGRSTSSTSSPPPTTTPMLSPSCSSTSSTSTTASKVMLRLHSAKMIGLKDLINSEKLNANAIQLQLTALSQVTSSKNELGLVAT